MSSTLLPAASVRAAFAPIVKAIENHAFALAETIDLVVIRPGYRNTDRSRPAIVAGFRPPLPAHADAVAREFALRTGVAVWATEASPEEQLRWLAAGTRPQRDPALERWFRGDDEPAAFPIMGSYEPPPNAPSLEPIHDEMRVTLCASPDAGWPVLSEFLTRSISRRLVVAMYHFTAPHIYQALRRSLAADPDVELHMVRNPTLGEAGAGTKADDLEGEVVVRRLRKALGDRFEYAKTLTGKAGIFGTAYHIKVAVADSKRFWLSSGNWQSTNQPPYDPIHAPDDLPPGYARKYNREYHAVIDHAGLAKTFEAYIEHDLASARDEVPPFELPEVAVPIEAELPDEFGPVQWFEPLRVHRKVKVQPVLTPDNYATVVLALIGRATRSVWFQNQYISLVETNNFEAFARLVQALRDQQAAGLDVRIICRDQMEAKKTDLLLGAGFDPDRLRYQVACHNKTIIVDGKEVLIGSHNWSNDGTVSNRDASLLFFDEEIAGYFAQIYDYDWSRARQTGKRRQPRVLRDGELPPAGTERTPFGDIFEDGRIDPGPGATINPTKPTPRPPEFPVTEPALELFPTGVREDGTPLAKRILIKDAADALRSRAAGALDPAVAAANARAGLESMGLPVGVTPDNLARAGWAVVFAEDVAPSIRDKLKPLLEHRAAQAGNRYKELAYKAGQSVREFLTAHNVTLSDITPSRVPYHLLLVGSPSAISFEFQYLLDLGYSVGRLWFDDEAGFASYANAVVKYETSAKVATRKLVGYFGPTNGGDAATKLSSEQLVTPLVDGTSDDAAIANQCGYDVRSLIGAAAKKAALLDLLHDGDQRPTLLFTASHGLQCPFNSQTQRQRQGALITADWTGTGVLDPQKVMVTAADVRDDATIHGLVAFMFACYGAGTPAVDQFSRDLEAAKAPSPIAPEPFISALAQRLLGHPSGGALGVIGHVERAWGCSIQPQKVDPQILPFRNAIGRILGGEPLGEATLDLSHRHATLSTELVGLLAPTAPAIDDRTLVYRWLEQTDARNYILLGDPAARVRTGGV